MSFAEEMMNLGEKLISSCENRLSNEKYRMNNEKKRQNDREEFCKNLTSNTGKTLHQFYNQHKTMAKNQRENLCEFTQNLTHNVGGFLKKCHKEQSNLHNMLQLAHKNFMGCMREIERKKKKGFFSPEPTFPKRGKPKKRTRH